MIRLLKYPALAWFFFFLLFPLGFVLRLAFADKGVYGDIKYVWTTAQFAKLFTSDLFFIFLRTFRLALFTSVFCFLIAIPLAWFLSSLPANEKNRWFTALCIPFFLNLISRVYGIKSFFSYDSPVTRFFVYVFGDAVDPFAFSQNSFLVFLGMTTYYLPFMLLPIYVAFEKFELAQLEAVYDLGGSSILALTKVILPQLRRAILTGFLLVFIPCFGEFVIPDLLGGATNMLIGNFITEQFLKMRNWALGSASSVFLILILIITSALIFSQMKERIRREKKV